MVVIKSWSSVFDKWRSKGHDLSFAAWKADQWKREMENILIAALIMIVPLGVLTIIWICEGLE